MASQRDRQRYQATRNESDNTRREVPILLIERPRGGERRQRRNQDEQRPPVTDQDRYARVLQQEHAADGDQHQSQNPSTTLTVLHVSVSTSFAAWQRRRGGCTDR